MQFDVNFLKTVNDIYGHAAGDTHIIAAADAICAGVGTMGKAFRTGGDEFVALMKKKKESDAAKAVENMLKKVNEYNEENDPPVELQIAYGYAAYSGSGSLSEAELEADKQMYDTKQEMKRNSKIKSMR
jgi:diguanylate cyclase (GGDEF)-like protein